MSEPLIITVEQGRLCGVVEKLPNGKQFHYFRGIPYAVPPLGEYRFEPPLPLTTFNTPLLDCSRDRNMCLQKFKNTTVGSENCLFLNVYTPSQSAHLLPVMIWIHGGGFYSGSGDSHSFSPEHLIQQDVIVVTINYRLGPLGFLYLPAEGIEGNLGLKDQLLAIKWVRQNISKFNGDRENITLFGQSAGAVCVNTHALSENSKQYFHKAICQSGTTLMGWTLQEQPEEKARKFAELCGFSGKPDAEIKEFLKQVPIESLKTAVFRQTEVLSEEELRRGLPMPFKIVVESRDTENAILTDNPLKLMKSRNKIEIPFLMGLTDCDGMFMLYSRLNHLDVIDKDISRFILKHVNLTPKSYASIVAGDELKKFYFGDKNLTMETTPSFIKLMTDYFFNVGQNLSLELHARYQQRSPLFFYRFCYDGGLNTMKQILKFSRYQGACHSDDNTYLFLMKANDVENSLSAKDRELRTTMCTLWTNFAKYGNPTPPTDQSLPFKWLPVKPIPEEAISFDLDCLNIDEKIEMIQNPDKDRIDFWRSMFKKWNNSFLNPKL